MEPLAYLHLQLRLEGKEIVKERFIRQVEAVSGEEVPLILIAQLATGKRVVYYDEQIPVELQQGFAEHISDIEFPRLDSLLAVLKKHDIEVKAVHYKTYIVPSILTRDPEVICFSKQDPKVKMFGFDGLGERIYGIERENKIVSACVSARENESCGEAWVYTEPDYRHQGFAQKVVRAWAEGLMTAGKVPFYSHEIDNTASANLAKRLGLQAVFEEISVTETLKEEKTFGS